MGKSKSGTSLYLAAIESKVQTESREPHDIDQTTVEKLQCPACKKRLTEPEAVRLKPRKKLSPKMQKLLRRRKENKDKLTSQQEKLLLKYLQSCNILVLKCRWCGWKGQKKLQSRTAFQSRRVRLTRKQVDPVVSECVILEDAKKAKHKLRKKERKRKAAEAKAAEQASRLAKSSSRSGKTEERGPTATTTLCSVLSQPFSQSLTQVDSVVLAKPMGPQPARKNTSCPPKQTVSKGGKVNSTNLGTVSRSESVLGMQSSGVMSRKKRKQSLKTMLNRHKNATNGQSAADSLSQFLNSLQ